MITDEIKTLLRAVADGKHMQVKPKSRKEWENANAHWALTVITNTVGAAGSCYDVRIKPEPLECWVNVYENNNFVGHKTKSLADENADPTAIRRAVHMREVIE